MTRKIILLGSTGTLGLYTVDHLVSTLDEDWEIVATGKQPNIAPREVIMPSQRMPPAKRLR